MNTTFSLNNQGTHIIMCYSFGQAELLASLHKSFVIKSVQSFFCQEKIFLFQKTERNLFYAKLSKL